MFWQTGNNGTHVTIILGGMPYQQAQPVCSVCGAPATRQRDQDGVLFCLPHQIEDERLQHERQAVAILTGLFRAVKPEQRRKLFRALSSVLHPDVGGSEALMKALNHVASVVK